MNILLITPLYASHWDAGHYWLKALSRMGHAITVWDYRAEPLGLRGHLHQDLILVMKGENVPLTALKAICPTAPLVCYWPDSFRRSAPCWPGMLMERYDHVFTPVRPTPEGMRWLPTGWDPDIHRPLFEERPYSYVYIGTNNSRYKYDMVEAIRPSVLAGNGWPKEMGAIPATYNQGFVETVSKAKVAINLHQDPEIGVNRKFFEMAACALTITDRPPGMEEILGDLRYKLTFRTADEARTMAAYYLTYPEEAKKIWTLEREKIASYTYERAAEIILRTAYPGYTP